MATEAGEARQPLAGLPRGAVGAASVHGVTSCCSADRSVCEEEEEEAIEHSGIEALLMPGLPFGVPAD